MMREVDNMETIKEVLITRDNIEPSEADRLIAEAKEAFNEALEEGDIESAEAVCEDYFGLEPDYIMELMS